MGEQDDEAAENKEKIDACMAEIGQRPKWLLPRAQSDVPGAVIEDDQACCDAPRSLDAQQLRAGLSVALQ